VLVDGGEPGVVAGLRECFSGGRLVKSSHIGEALSPFGDHPNTDAGRLSRGELLDLTFEDPYGGLPAMGNVDLDLFVVVRLREHTPGEAQKIRHPRYLRS
jgi:hypothetical protein